MKQDVCPKHEEHLCAGMYGPPRYPTVGIGYVGGVAEFIASSMPQEKYSMRNRFLKLRYLVPLMIAGVFVFGDLTNVQAARNGRSTRTLRRPVTGFGANIHRRFILKQELKRQSQGLPVRYRGNIRWSR